MSKAGGGPHDLGGLDGFGPIPRDQEDHLPWHESVMRMLFALALMGLSRTSGEVRYFVETMSREEYRSRGYYERWLVAVEALLERARHADPTALANTASAPSAAVLGLGDDEQPSPRPGGMPESDRFDVGTTVTVRDDPAPGHNRLPMYVRSRTGIVHAVYPPLEVPGTPYDDLRHERVYNVAFRASDLWPDAQSDDEVRIDLFASNLHR